MHKAASTVNQLGVQTLISLRTDVNAVNERKQAVYDVCFDSNRAVAAKWETSPTWDRMSHQGASQARQSRAAGWRERKAGSSGSSGSQPGPKGKAGQGKGFGSQPGKGKGGGWY